MKKFVWNIFVIYMIFEIFLPQKVFAYLDPGTGSLITQIIIATVASIGCTITIWKDKILSIFKKGSKDD